MILPDGLTQAKFDEGLGILRGAVRDKGYNGRIFLHGSRVGGSPRPDSDFDFAIRVTPEEFDRIANARLSTLTPGSTTWRTIQYGIGVGKLQRGEIGLSGIGRQLEAMYGVRLDISIIRIGGPFDNGPWYPVG